MQERTPQRDRVEEKEKLHPAAQSRSKRQRRLAQQAAHDLRCIPHKYTHELAIREETRDRLVRLLRDLDFNETADAFLAIYR